MFLSLGFFCCCCCCSFGGFFETILGVCHHPPPLHPWLTKHLFLDCTKEDGGISSCPRNALKISSSLLTTSWCKKRINILDLLFILDWILFLNAFYLYPEPLFSFLVYISVIIFPLCLIWFLFFVFYIYSGIYENKLWTQESHFSCWSVLQKIET